jgi:hypothetical protein
MAAVQRQIGRISPLDPAELVASSESCASAVVDGNESADAAVALSEHEALGLRIEATRAQCEECFGAALFERVYRALRDASDAQNRTVDDLQVRCFHFNSNRFAFSAMIEAIVSLCFSFFSLLETQGFTVIKKDVGGVPKSLLPFVRYVRQLIALENAHFGT